MVGPMSLEEGDDLCASSVPGLRSASGYLLGCPGHAICLARSGLGRWEAAACLPSAQHSLRLELGLKTARSGMPVLVKCMSAHLASDTALPCCCRCLHQAEAPSGVASPHGFHRQDFIGKDVLVVLNISFLGNGKT